MTTMTLPSVSYEIRAMRDRNLKPSDHTMGEWADAIDAHLAKGAQVPDDVRLALDYSRNFAEANPNLTNTAKEHILGLCDLLEKHACRQAMLSQCGEVEGG